MRFRKVAVLRGPNIWANSPVIEAWVELGPLKDTASNAVPGFNDRLKSWLPSMIEHECSEGHRGGFFLRLDEGTYPAHILEHVTLELQSLAGTPVGYGRARVTSEEGVYRVVFKYREEAVGLACLETARELILAALADRPFDVPAQVQRLRDLARKERPGPSTGALIAAAKGRNIPCRRLGGESLIQLGHGARAAADLRHRDRPDRGDRLVHRPRQGADTPAPRRRGGARARRPAGGRRRRRLGRRRGAGISRRDQATGLRSRPPRRPSA